MASSALRVPSPPSSPSPSSYTSIHISSSSISYASSCVPSVYTISLSSPVASSSSSYSSVLFAYSSLLLCPSLYTILCTTACVAPSVPASRPVHSCRFPHAVFSWSPAALITSLARSWRIVYPIPTGRTPGLLSNATSQHVISVQ